MFPTHLAELPYAYLTTRGRRSGQPREIEIWFAGTDDPATVYVMSGRPDRAQWVRNLRADPSVQVRIGEERVAARAELLEPGTAEDADARARLVRKYATPGQSLEGWGRGGLPVALRAAEPARGD